MAKKDYISSGTILIKENFHYNMGYNTYNPMKDFFFIKDIDFYEKDNKKKKRITIYWDQAWKVYRLREQINKKDVEVMEPERSRLAELFFSSIAAQKTLGDIEEMFRAIEYIQCSPNIEFHRLYVERETYELEHDKQDPEMMTDEENFVEETVVKFVLKGFERFSFEAIVEVENQEITYLEFHFPYDKVFLLNYNLHLLNDKLFNAIISERRFNSGISVVKI